MDWHEYYSRRQQEPPPPFLPSASFNRASEEISWTEFLATSDPADARNQERQRPRAVIESSPQRHDHLQSLAFENLHLANRSTPIKQTIIPTASRDTINSSANTPPTRPTVLRHTSSSITVFREHDMIGDYIGSGRVFTPMGMDPTTPTMASSIVTVPPPPTVTSKDHTQLYIAQLQSLVLPGHILKQNNYVLGQLSADKLAAKTRCQRCKKLYKPVKQPTPQSNGRSRSRKRDEGEGEEPEAKRRRSVAESISEPQPSPRPQQTPVAPQTYGSKAAKSSRETASANPPVSLQTFQQVQGRCRYHPGVFAFMLVNGQSRKVWHCCNKNNPYEEGCTSAEDHVALHPPNVIEEKWRHYPTPPNYYSDIRAAVAIDCEMGMTKENESDLIRVSMVDYFTGEELVNSLVKPDEELEHPNTKYSGVTWKDLNAAFRSGDYLKGKKGAREAVWRFVGGNTIVVAHGGSNDLTALRWIHMNVVDTHLIDFLPVEACRREIAKIEAAAKKAATEEAAKFPSRTELRPASPPNRQLFRRTNGTNTVTSNVGGMPKAKKSRGAGTFSLKGLTKAKLGRDIQMAGNKGHCSLEDAIAARDLAHWHVVYKTNVLRSITGPINPDELHLTEGIGSLAVI